MPTPEVQMSGKRDSNPRPPAWEASALPTELFPLINAKIISFALIHKLWVGSMQLQILDETSH